MPTGQEILGSLYGAWRILRFDQGAMQHFNRTIEGFWRSFFAIILVAPLSLTFVLIHSQRFLEELEIEAEPSTIAVVHLIKHVLSWLAFPLAMIWMTRLLNLTQHYVSFIIAWNWSNVIAAAIMVVPALIGATGVIADGLTQLIITGAFAYMLFYAYLVARAGLACNTGTAIGIVVFEIVLKTIIELTLDALMPLN